MIKRRDSSAPYLNKFHERRRKQKEESRGEQRLSGRLRLKQTMRCTGVANLDSVGTATLEPTHHQTFDPFRARATNETCLLLTASPRLQIQHHFPQHTLTPFSQPKMSSMDSSADDREGLMDVLRNTLRFLSCSSYREPTHSYMELGADEAPPGRPELPRQATYCSLPRGIRRMSAPTTEDNSEDHNEDHNDGHENTDSS